MSRRLRAHLVRLFPPAPHGGVVPHPFEGARMTLGTSPDCSVVLDEGTPGIAPLHARLDRMRDGKGLRAFARDGAVWVDGRPVGAKGAAVSGGSVVRLEGAVFLVRLWDEDEAAAAALSPLPGPVNSCHPTVVRGLRRLQGWRHGGGTFWVVGEDGCGRSVVIDHLRALVEESSGRDWITGGPSLEAAAEAPPSADPDRTLLLPPLRDRGEDLLVLITALCGGHLPQLAPDLVEAMLLYDWPGNIRELRLAVARAHDPRFGAEDPSSWKITDFPDVQRYVSELTGAGDPITVQSPKRPLPTTEPEMRTQLDAHWWRIHTLAAATGHSRAEVLRHLFSLGIREPWRRPGVNMLRETSTRQVPSEWTT